MINAVDATVTRMDADALAVDFKVPIDSEEAMVKMFTDVCRKNKSIKVAVIDHISSQSAIMFPVAKIATALHELGVLVVVDGAHAPGQAHVDLEELGRAGVDFYSGNLHKWGFAPRGCAILWVHPR